jgi:hypothetical protein
LLLPLRCFSVWTLLYCPELRATQSWPAHLGSLNIAVKVSLLFRTGTHLDELKGETVSNTLYSADWIHISEIRTGSL